MRSWGRISIGEKRCLTWWTHSTKTWWKVSRRWRGVNRRCGRSIQVKGAHWDSQWCQTVLWCTNTPPQATWSERQQCQPWVQAKEWPKALLEAPWKAVKAPSKEVSESTKKEEKKRASKEHHMVWDRDEWEMKGIVNIRQCCRKRPNRLIKKVEAWLQLDFFCLKN